MSFLPLQQLTLCDDKYYTFVVPAENITRIPVLYEYQNFVLTFVRNIVWAAVELIIRLTYNRLNAGLVMGDVQDTITMMDYNHILFDIEGVQEDSLNEMVSYNSEYTQYIIETSSLEDSPIGRFNEDILNIALHSVYWQVIEITQVFYYLGYTLEIEDVDYFNDKKNFYVSVYLTQRRPDIEQGE